MADASDLTDQLAQSIADGEPQQASVDGRSVTDHSIPDKIKGIQFVAAIEAAASRRTGIRVHRVVPPGAGPQ